MGPLTMNIHIRNTPDPVHETKPAPKRVLVVDDLPEICATFRDAHRRIRGMAVELTVETNSERALKLAKEKPFDLVVSDFRMKEVDGISILTAARETDPRGHRILMTGYNEIPASIERIKQARVDAYVQKPLRGNDLLLLLTGFLRNDPALIEEHRAHARELEGTTPDEA